MIIYTYWCHSQNNTIFFLVCCIELGCHLDDESSRQQVFFGKSDLNNFTKFAGKYFFWSLGKFWKKLPYRAPSSYYFCIFNSPNQWTAFYIKGTCVMKVLMLKPVPGANLKPCQTSERNIFAELIDSWKPLNIFTKMLIIDVWQGSKYASVWN